ncbi:MAG TPA: glycosyl hydrolase [Actinophytocola sp.]|uniref:WD40/YVTN/BNR-like repeat-containing protein n=1 Tax=Actinophytocola sp. TaxID=1872138 RepID=UPI002DB8E7DC|nr:glycosyl hydrolase [Actinophytocola sp.]HEU5469244.1 glycosyl hydrolase [Actinophytocola sp.]
MAKFGGLTALALLLAVTASIPGATVPTGTESAFGGPEPEAEGLAGPAGADGWLAAQRLYPFPSLNISAMATAARGTAAAIAAAPGIQAAWQQLGPANIGGRVTDLVVHPTQPNLVFAGAATGGVWKSTDAATTFTTTWNPTLTPSIGALAITSTGTLYAGTGEANPGGGSVTFPGAGVFRSADNGASWQSVGLTGTDRIGRIAADPGNANRLFVAAAGNLFVPGGQRGLYRTTDGGSTWQLVLAGANGTTGAVDVAISPTDPNRIYAAMWDHQRQPNGRVYGGTGSGIYRSTNGGTSWTRLAGGLPAAGTNLGRMGIAVARSNPNRLYAIASDTSGDFVGFWTSTNAGDTWTRLTNTSLVSSAQSTFGWWFGRIWVDPANASHVFVAGVNMVESLDAGANWRRSSLFHADQHAMAWDPLTANRVYLGNDGGVYRSTANGSLTGAWTKSTSQAHLQFYTVAVSKQDTSRISGGLQDNGSVRSWGGSNWNSILGGDGLMNLIDPTNQNKIYACSQNGSCRRSTDGGNTMTAFGATTSDRRNWLTPVAFDPSNPAIMYYAGNRLNRSTNSAATWTAISPDLSRGPGGIDGYPFGTITTHAAARISPATIYVGTDDGRMWITRNTGGTWTEITAGLPTRWITHVTVDPTDANLAYVSVSGFRNGDPAAHVFRTSNGGSSWQDISGNLPDAPVNDLVLDPRDRTRLYAATDVGAFLTTDNGATWTTPGTGLPLVPISDLEATDTGSTTVLTAATYGLGIYRLS